MTLLIELDDRRKYIIVMWNYPFQSDIIRYITLSITCHLPHNRVQQDSGGNKTQVVGTVCASSDVLFVYSISAWVVWLVVASETGVVWLGARAPSGAWVVLCLFLPQLKWPSVIRYGVVRVCHIRLVVVIPEWIWPLQVMNLFIELCLRRKYITSHVLDTMYPLWLQEK